MTRVHVIGAAGYAAAEVIRLLDAHPEVELGVLESASLEGERLADHFPLLRTAPYCCAGPGSVLEAVAPGEIVVTAGGEEESRAFVPSLLVRNVRVIDLSSLYRHDPRAAYGLAEWHRDAIARASLVANPGCYPTAALLALLPLAPSTALGVTERLRHIVVDAKSGVTGAGRTPKVGSLFAEVSGDVRAYGLDGHRHQPEIETELDGAGLSATLTFTPHVVPIARGMLVDAYAIFDAPLDPGAVAAAYRKAYAASPFVRLLESDRVPSVAAVVGTNEAELYVDVDGAVVRAICAIDNLGKGAAGQAVQNLNIMLGLPQECGLNDRVVVA